MTTKKVRKTLYINAELDKDTQAVADELGISLSKLTELLYTQAVGIRGIAKSLERMGEHFKQVEEQHPEGIPVENVEGVVRKATETLIKAVQMHIQYTAGMLQGMQAENVTVNREVDISEIFRESLADMREFAELAGIKKEGATTPTGSE